MEFGIHFADFTQAGGPGRLGSDLAQHVKNAQAAGIARVTVMDHFWQIQTVGPYEHEMVMFAPRLLVSPDLVPQVAQGTH